MISNHKYLLVLIWQPLQSFFCTEDNRHIEVLIYSSLKREGTAILFSLDSHAILTSLWILLTLVRS